MCLWAATLGGMVGTTEGTESERSKIILGPWKMGEGGDQDRPASENGIFKASPAALR